MQSTTLLIATIACLLALILRPIYALAVYVIAMLWYPSYLVVTVGTIDISVGRFVVGVLFLRCLFDSRIRSNFTWTRLDTIVAISMIVYVGIFCMTVPLSYSLENRSGFLMDTWFAYIVARFIVADRQRLVTFTKIIGLALVSLAILGAIESASGWQPFLTLKRFCPWKTWKEGNLAELRWGFFRATGPFEHPILFGCDFAMFLPLIYYLRHQKNYWHVLAYILAGVALIGALSSMSSGSWVMTIAVVFGLAMERQKRWVKPLLVSFICTCIFIAVVSNRPFYHVIVSYANPLGGAGWHRARLIDVAIEHFNEWWFAGYGGKDPGWGHYLGMGHTDVTNEFILAGVKYGIWGVIALCGVLAASFYGLIRAYKMSLDPELKSLYWCLGCLLFSVVVTWFSVPFFGQLMPLFYFILGVIASSLLFDKTPRYGWKTIAGIEANHQLIPFR